MNHSNTQRAKRFARALRTYGDEYSPETYIIDLLADARHWCDRENESFADLDRMAYQHYAAEKVAERGRKS